ncbi:enoyl-CoA hydratase/isomerase family protein [Bradymonadaceae bacterium TMQ3]|uniref:Enoyl-CoA hydratase/isomerase family protein n=1 Tax=Lujinxingia sediminis TaxID=2480984 RepID=A0ABY0CXT1_9DELT|nr:enoyl-CoA hydratase-related protein [Lujinxingia sediminis]RDV39285.1 enoyl-CoA hydratase/isomerase family protein [Bradymonadaceae bacterium TMQ3]RVU48676.1 enoyl-CoA hydratase/isomerase family protein [Lujinxingia sediminis]TXC77969.1 enoyl-CoA hydratase/isomerase family protein [Bradymonadales bacterium TMQ1]
MTTFETLKLERLEDGIALLTVNRPDKLNALNAQVLSDLYEAAISLKDDASLRALILTGEGRAFVAGADIAAMSDMSEEASYEFSSLGHRAMTELSNLPVPVIAAVNGFALGGGLELALTADLIYVSEKARLGLPETGLGIVPGFGGTQRLGRRIGWQRAKELVFTGRTISADDAVAYGLALDKLPLEGFLDAIIKLARSISTRGPLAIRAAKQAMVQGSELPIDDANQKEVEAFSGLWNSHDRAEGMAAFLEKRTPTYEGR